MKKIFIFLSVTFLTVITATAQKQAGQQPDKKTNVTSNGNGGTSYSEIRYINLREATVTLEVGGFYRIAYLTENENLTSILIKDSEFGTFARVVHAAKNCGMNRGPKKWQFSFYREVTINAKKDPFWTLGYGAFEDCTAM